MTATKHELVIERWRSPSLNATLRSHWAARARAVKTAAALIGIEAARQGVPKAKRKRRVSLRIALTPRQKPFDHDNSWKLLLDALVKAGLLIDDSPGWCETGAVEYERGPETKTVIVLEDLE